MKKHTLAAHNINILFWVQFFGSISFIQPVLTLFYMERGLTGANILWVMMFWSGAVLIGEVPTGVFADRFGAKASFITGSAIRLLSTGLLIFAEQPELFYLSSLLSGFSAAFFSGADEALIYESLRESKEQHFMERAMGKIQSATFITMIVAVLIGAYIAKDLKDEQFILLLGLGLLCQVVELSLLFFIRNPGAAESYRENPFSQVKKGLKAIQTVPQLLVMFINVTLVFIPAAAVFDKFDQPLLKAAGLPVSMIGVVYALTAVLGYIASRSIGWMTSKFSRIGLMYATGAMAVAGLLVAGVFGDALYMVLLSIFILRFVRAVRYPIYSQLSNDMIPSHARATTISLLSILDSVFDLIIFSALSGMTAGGFNLYLACAGIALVGTLLPIRRIKSREDVNYSKTI